MKSVQLESITSSLIRKVFKWVILCVLVFSSLQAWLNYRAIEKNFQLTVNDIANTHIPLLSVAIWDIEPETIQKQIVLLLKNKPISYVIIRASTGQQFVGGNPEMLSSGDHITLNIPSPLAGVSDVGTLELVVDHSILRQELMRSFMLVSIEVVLLAAFILVAVVTILRRNLEKPMRQLAEFVRNLQADQLSNPMNLQLPGHIYTEIDLVIDGFRTMQASIQKHITHQDALVMERTQQLEDAMASLKQLSITDGLTSCFNRLLFNERMPAEMQRANRYNRPLSIVFCDIDYFKKVNDQYGHSVGDTLLIAFAQTLRQELRAEIDWVVRYGGEEFLVILPETSFEAALEVAQRMRHQVEQGILLNLSDGQQLKITASFGVAEKEPGDTVETLVQRADQCLYLAKAQGRNQVQPEKPAQ
jgi:two-component system cell cycle response regulator